MARTSRISKAQRAALARLSKGWLGSRVYLAGGVAIAWHFEHRSSRDLDLFSKSARFSLVTAKKQVARELSSSTVVASEAMLDVHFDGVEIDVVRYPYGLIDTLDMTDEGMAVARPRDLGAMKLSAIATRGIRRDFWDLMVLLSRGGLTLAGLLDDYAAKFSIGESDRYHVVRSLTWFEDAERDTLYPDGLNEARWKKVRAFFEAEVKKLR